MRYDETTQPRTLRPLAEDAQHRVMAMVEMAIRRGNPAEAHAAIDRAFTARDSGRIDLGGSLHQLGLPSRTVTLIEKHGVRTVLELSGYTAEELRTLPQIGDKTIEEIEAGLEAVGLHLRGAVQKRA